jgi:UDP-glucose 4-epimerase
MISVGYVHTALAKSRGWIAADRGANVSRTYLVTGGAGFIGSHLCDALCSRGDRVVILDNLSSGKLANVAELPSGIEFIEGDVRDLPELEGKIQAVDGIVHLAALISGYDSLSVPDEYEDVNVRGTLRVIEFASRRKIGRIVFASSSTIYGDRSGAPLRESDLPAPLTVYALSKLVGEHLLDLYGKMHGFSHCSLRLFNVYGPRQATDHPYANVTCKFSHAAANALPVKLYGDGEQSRDFVYVADVVNAFLAVLDGAPDTIYNVGTGQDASINSLLESLSRLSGRRLAVEHCPAWANDIRRIRADTSRLRETFGLVPQTSLSEGLAETIAFFQGHRTAAAA